MKLQMKLQSVLSIPMLSAAVLGGSALSSLLTPAGARAATPQDLAFHAQMSDSNSPVQPLIYQPQSTPQSPNGDLEGYDLRQKLIYVEI